MLRKTVHGHLVQIKAAIALGCLGAVIIAVIFSSMAYTEFRS